MSINVTFSTCWYIAKSKFNASTYAVWIDNMLANVNNYYLVVYTDNDSKYMIEKYTSNPNIKIIVKPFEGFYTYKYKKEWIENHARNPLLNTRIDWKINMLWSEKVHFVKNTMNNKYFETDYYGWCDIGYFRDSSTDLRTWPSSVKINNLNKNTVYYAIVNNNTQYMNVLQMLIQNKNKYGLPICQLPADQVSIAGGFFITHKENVDWWANTYDEKLQLYFRHNYLVKDDQIIVIDCIFSDMKHFTLMKEVDPRFDIWFQFRRHLA
jgi:hypothetical protein